MHLRRRSAWKKSASGNTANRSADRDVRTVSY
jgi:hypothetical protein